ncbi:hypothetical protein BDD12DRAFT_913060 [Trichophaea hybrida]|nr:hypothetical protein BDD12DRAFT_913060 [Trichophaea hybrida]
MKTQTIVSVYIPRRPKQDLKTVDACSDSDNSQTSFASSPNGKSAVRVPPPPPLDPKSAFDGKPFQCPYCYEIVSSVPNGLGGPVSAHNWPGPHVTGPAAEGPIPTGFMQTGTMDNWASHGS